MSIFYNGIDVTGLSYLRSVSNGSGDFVTIDGSNIVRRRTPSQVLTDIGGQPLITNPVTGTGASGQVAFWNGTNTISGNTNLTYSLGNLTLTGTNGSIVLGSTGDSVSFTRNGPVYISANGGSSSQLYFEVNGAERWRMLATGAFQSNGAQTIQTSTGNLTIATAGGNGNILLTPNGTGSVQSSKDIALTTNATYYRSSNTLGGLVRMLGINAGNVAYVGAIDSGPVSTVFNASATSLVADFYIGGSIVMRHFNGNVMIGTTTDSGNRLRVDGTVRFDSVTNATGDFVTIDANNVLRKRTATETRTDIGAYPAASVSIASGQVAFGTGTNTIGGDAGLVWNNTSKFLALNTAAGDYLLRLHKTGTADSDHSYIHFTTDDVTTSLSRGFTIGLAADTNVYINNRENTSIFFATNNTTRWSINNTGVLQSNGAQTIRSSTGELTLRSEDSNLILNPFGEVKVKTTQSGANLVVGSSLNITDATTVLRSVVSAGVAYFGTTTNHPLILRTNVTDRWRLTTAGVFESIGAQTIQTSTGSLTIATAGGNGNVIITPNGTGFLDSQLRTLLRGNVTIGINTLTDRGRLHVLSSSQTAPTLGNTSTGISIIASNTDSNYGTVFFTKSSGQGTIQQMRVDGTATSYSLTLQELGGNVLIGTTSDNGNRFQVNGRGTFSSTSDSQITLISPDTWAGITFTDSSASDNIWFNGSNSTFSIGGAGTNVAGKKLHVEGGVTIGSGHRVTAVPTNGLTVEGTVLVGKTTDAGEKFQVNGNALITNALISNQENLDVDSAAAEVVAQISSTTYTAVFFDYSIKNGTNIRSGTVYATHNGTNVVFTETSTADLGNTSGVELSVDINGGNIRLLATVTTDNWVIKTLIRGI
jgi:hypothetical protein